MPRMLVVTDAETANGFRLAGVEAIETDGARAQEVLEEAILSNDYGLVVVDESLIADPVAASARVMRGRDLPVLLPMPGLSAAFDHESDATSYMQQLVRSAIGFDIKLD
ncbi:MAG: V-type ATP synthase subunit F [Trueperaceae bacterium]|nr:V-type ATP synthase subunit F [Trueperaceae bacterium]